MVLGLFWCVWSICRILDILKPHACTHWHSHSMEHKTPVGCWPAFPAASIQCDHVLDRRKQKLHGTASTSDGANLQHVDTDGFQWFITWFVPSLNMIKCLFKALSSGLELLMSLFQTCAEWQMCGRDMWMFLMTGGQWVCMTSFWRAAASRRCDCVIFTVD